jgi:hypothetical protein
VGRTNAVARFPEEELLHRPVLERVEGDDRETAAGNENAHGRLESALKIVELAVHRDAQRLEHARRGIDPARSLTLHAEHELSEVVRREERLARAAAHDGGRDTRRLGLLAVLREHAAELASVPGVHDVGRRDAKVWVGAHVQRARCAEAEAPLGVGELDRREAEVEENAVERVEAVFAGHDVANREVRADKDGPGPEAGKDTPRLDQRGWVDVETEESAGRRGPLEDGLGVASRADRAVQEAATFAGIKLGEYFGQKNRLMKPPTNITRPRGP